MELTTASLLLPVGWFIQAAGAELMLFAGAGLLLLGLDDLLVDACYLARRQGGGGAAAVSHDSTPSTGSIGPMAIFVPAWQEAAVLPVTAARILAAWPQPWVRLYIGCYSNDAATLLAMSRLVAGESRMRLVISPHAGPTTKAENLNQMWQAMLADEAAEGMCFAGVVLQDAEDMVHQDAITLIRAALANHDMVQLPVQPVVPPGSPWISGHYADEFAESHGRDIVVRMLVGAPLPAAGVGCAFSRRAMLALARARGGLPFCADSLTEDYEAGLMVQNMGLPGLFLDTQGRDGQRVATRSAFPATPEAAARQKARWTAGIALAGWDRLGWFGAMPEPARRAGSDRVASAG